MVAAAAVVFAHNRLQAGGDDDAAVQELAREEMVPQQFAQGAAEPVSKGNSESHLVAVEQLRGQPVTQRLQENQLAAPVLCFPGIGNFSGNLRQYVIQ